MTSLIGVRTIKTGVGATLAIIIAQCLGLKYIYSAGIIAILSVQSTRKESLEIAIRRLGATGLALLVSSILFSILGFTPLIFGVYLICFIPLAAKLKVTEGIAPASVLVTHLLTEQKIEIGLLGNEILLMGIGAGVALLLNLYMPSVERQLLEDKKQVERSMYKLLIYMAKHLQGIPVDLEVTQVEEVLNRYLEKGEKRAHRNANNYFFNFDSPYEKYFHMRTHQAQVMHYMLNHLEGLSMNVEQGSKIATFIYKVAQSTKGKVLVEPLLEELEALREVFRQSDLPSTREEFENRAMLYQFLNDIQHYLEIKKKFKEGLTYKQLEEYSSYYD